MFPTARDLPVGSFDFESLGHAAATYHARRKSYGRQRGSLVSNPSSCWMASRIFSPMILPFGAVGES